MYILRIFFNKISKRKYISLSQAILFQYIFIFWIFFRPLPVFENIEFSSKTLVQISYLVLPEISYYLLVLFSLLKTNKLKIRYVNKFIAYIFITPNLMFSIRLLFCTLVKLNLIFEIVFT